MPKSPESGSSEDEQYRVKFEMAPEQEQIDRFSAIKSLYVDRSNGQNKDDKKRADYFQFIQNSYKYAEKYPLTVDGVVATEKQKREIFSEAISGNEIIFSALNYFQAAKSQDGSVERKNSYNDWLKDLERTISLRGGKSRDKNKYFADTENKQLNVEKLVGCFKFSLDAFTKQKEGRTAPEGLTEEISPMSDDLETILKKVNEWR